MALRWRLAVFFVLGAGLDILASVQTRASVWQGSLINPDSYMRLVRLRGMLLAGRPLDAVGADGSGAGTVLHWSHLLDGLLLMLAAPLGLFFDRDTALFWAGVASGPLSVGLLAVACAWAVAPLVAPSFLWAAAVAAALATGTVNYGMLGSVHHHVLVEAIAVIVAGAAGRAACGWVRAGWWLGLWAAIGIWLSPETLPFTLMGFGALGLAWLVASDAAPGSALVRAGIGFAAAIAAFLALDPPESGFFAVEIDRLSGVYFALGVVALATCLALGANDGLRGGRRVALGLGAMILPFGLWCAAFPAVLRGPDGLMDAAQAAAFFGPIEEMHPVGGAWDAVIHLSPGVFAAAVALLLAWRRRSLLWAYAGLCAIAAVVLGATHLRFTPYGQAMAAMLLPVALAWATAALATGPRWRLALTRIALVGCVLVLPRGVAIARAGIAGKEPPAPAACSLRHIDALLAPYGGQIVLAHPNDAPELLWRTQVLTVGSLFHRNIAAFMRLRAALFSADAEVLPEAVRVTGAQLVLICPDARAPRVVGQPEGSLLARLRRGEVPAWLETVQADPVSGYVLYRVRP